MLKHFAIAAGCVAATLQACSSTETHIIEVPSDGGPARAVVDAGPYRDVQLGDARAAGIPCAPQPLDGSVTARPLPPTKRYPGICSDAEIDQLVSSCVEKTGLFDACTTARAAAPGCSACLFPNAFILDFQLLSSFGNVITCVALVENDAGPNSCASSANDLQACEFASCNEVCPQEYDQPNVPLSAFFGCATEADKGACAALVARSEAACGGDGGPLDSGRPDKFERAADLADCQGALADHAARVEWGRVVCGFQPDGGDQ